MFKANESSRLAWLAAVWSEKRHAISRLLGRIADLGSLQGMKPKIFTKFLGMLDQVASAKDEEVRIISEIDAIERKHRLNRNMGFVKHVGADNTPALEHPYGKGRHKNGWLWLLVVWWYLMTTARQRRIYSKKQSLKPD